MGYPGTFLNHENAFRLITLHPGQANDPLNVGLEQHHLKDAPTFEALSYVWGDPSIMEPISVIVSGVVEFMFDVTKNCAAALRRLRKPDEVRTLWIDAICIDQSEVEERTHQLSLIPKIYATASRVMIYLGPSTEQTDTALTWIRDIDNPVKDKESWNVPPDKSPKPEEDVKTAIRDLFNVPWFSRVWVLQEIRYAQSALVICGQQVVDWSAFKNFKYWNASQKWVAKLPYPVEWSTMKLTWGYGQSDKEFLAPYAKRLYKKLRVTRECGASDSRDKLFAIFPLLEWERVQFEKQKKERMKKEKADRDDEATKDETTPISEESREETGIYAVSASKNQIDVDEEDSSQDQDVVPIKEDYSFSATSLFATLSEVLINALGLKMLKEVVTPTVVPGLPSWVVDWSTNTKYPFQGRHGSRRAQRELNRLTQFDDIQWGTPEQKDEVEKTWSFSSTAEGQRRLHVSSIHLGRIAKLGDMADIYEDYLPLAQWEALIADRPDLLTVTNKDPPPNTDASWDEHHQWEMSQIPPFIRCLSGDEITYRTAVEIAVARIRAYNEEPRPTPSPSASYEKKSKWRESYAQKNIREEREEHERGGKGKLKLKDILASMGVSYEDQAEKIFYHCHGRRFVVFDNGRIGFVPWNAAIGDEMVSVKGAEAEFVVRGVSGQQGEGKEAKVVEIIGRADVHGVKSKARRRDDGSKTLWEGEPEGVEELIIR